MKETWDELINRQLTEVTKCQKDNEKEIIDSYKSQEACIKKGLVNKKTTFLWLDDHIEKLKSKHRLLETRMSDRHSYERGLHEKYKGLFNLKLERDNTYDEHQIPDKDDYDDFEKE